MAGTSIAADSNEPVQKRLKAVSESIDKEPLQPWVDNVSVSDQRRHAQVEWSEEADFIDEECELPYPGYRSSI